MPADQIKAYFFSDYDPQDGGREPLGVQMIHLANEFQGISSAGLVALCAEIDKSARNERNSNLQADRPYENRVAHRCLRLVSSFLNLSNQAQNAEKVEFTRFMSYYFRCLADNRPFATDDTAHNYLLALHNNTQSINDSALDSFIIVCAFSLLMDMLMAIAYTSGMTDEHVQTTLQAMQSEATDLKRRIRNLLTGNLAHLPQGQRELLEQLVNDNSDFPKKAFTYYQDKQEDPPNEDAYDLDGLMSMQIGRYNARICTRDINLMQLTCKRSVPREIRQHFPLRTLREHYWFLAREVELCTGVVVIPNVEIIIAFRGSRSVGDWITDFNAFSDEYVISDPSRPTKVHRGFHRTLNEHWTQIRDLIDGVRQRNPQFNTANWKFRVVGHSLGASWARLAALKIAPEYHPIHRIHLSLAAYPGVFKRAQRADTKIETLIVRNYYLKYDIFVKGGSLVMIRDLPTWQVCPRKFYLPIGSHFLFNIDDMMDENGETAPTINYQNANGFSRY